MKYLVITHCLEWHNIGYIVEADSKEEARDLVISEGEGEVYFDDFDTTEQIDVESIKEYED